jgi:hypothetical protein
VLSLNELEAYLRVHFVDYLGTSNTISVSYLDSSTNLDVQFADIICNTYYRMIKEGTVKKENCTDKHISFFPYKNFGT